MTIIHRSSVHSTLHLLPDDPLVRQIRAIAADYTSYYFQSMTQTEILVYVHARLGSSEARAEFENVIHGADRDRLMRAAALALARKDVEHQLEQRRRCSSIPPPLPQRPRATIPVEFLNRQEKQAILDSLPPLSGRAGSYAYVGCSPEAIAAIEDFRNWVRRAPDVLS